IVEATGNIEVLSKAHAMLWSSHTSGHPGAQLAVQVAGRLAVVVKGATVWASSAPYAQLLPGERLKPSWQLTSPNGRCRVVQLTAGPLTLVTADGQTLWSSQTVAKGATTVQLRDGDLQVLDATWSPVWESYTGKHAGARLQLTDTGRLVMSTRTGTQVWATP
ncbi:MAG TPA: hypothetical protein VIE15_01795, partial [Acidimicrobiales bacterium]